MKKFLHLTCTACKRSIDKLVDLTHYTPDQCTITLGCEGRLQPQGYRSSGAIGIAPEVGLTEWHPRQPQRTARTGEVLEAQTELPVLETRFISLETGELKQLVLAVPSSSEPLDTATYSLDFTVQADTPKAYRQYIFRNEGAFTTVSGVESGLEKKTLRFTAYGENADLIEIFVNGVKRELGTEPENYQLPDGTAQSAVPPNTILFNTPIEHTGVTQVDIIISKEQASSIFTLVFQRNKADEARVGLGAFENVDFVQALVEETWLKYYLFTLDLEVAGIPLNTILIPSTVSSAMFLLARKPYTQYDRYMNIVVPVSNMSIERDYIKYHKKDGTATAQITETSVVPIFPPLRVHKFAVEKIIKTFTGGVQEQVTFDGRMITGPDA